MKIVVLDGYTLNPGDLDWGPLKALGPCEIYDRTPPRQVIERAQKATVLLTNKVSLTASHIDKLDALQYIGVLATGYNVVDLQAASKRAIPVTNVPEYGTVSVAQMVFAHILNLTQQVALHALGVKAGKWAESKDFCYWEVPLHELFDKKLGIIGYGRIGKAVAAIGRAMGMQILLHDPHAGDLPEQEKTSMETLIEQSDIVSLHCPLTPKTEKMINAEKLGRMKSSALLINCSRGPLVDEDALADALNRSRIAGAGLDVLSDEPPQADNPLFSAKNCWITPHIAWATVAARQRLLDTVVENIKAFLHGHPQNVVNDM